MKKFRDYLNESYKTHAVRIKTINELNNDVIKNIVYHMQKYGVSEAIGPSNTPLMPENKYFPNHRNVRVYSMDFVCDMPVSEQVLKQELSNLLKCDPSFFVVLGEGNPMDTEPTPVADEVALDGISKQPKRPNADYVQTGQEYVDQLLANINAMRKTRDFEYAGPKSEEYKEPSGEYKENPMLGKYGQNMDWTVKNDKKKVK